MFSRLRSTWQASGGALLLVLALTGAALGADSTVTSSTPAPESLTAPLAIDTVGTFEDADGDGIDDDCDADTLPDPATAAAAELAVDLDGDGTVSTSEAARSGRIGGVACNHGGYVSGVAQAQCESEPTTPEVPGEGTPTAVKAADDADDETEDVDEDGAEAVKAPCTDDGSAVAEDAECVEVPAPVFDPTLFTGPGAFGAYASTVAGSDAVGGKNCNHGGAVSDAVKAAKEATRAERDAIKAAAAAERAASKAERQGQRDAAKTERAAARGQSNGKGKGRGSS